LAVTRNEEHEVIASYLTNDNEKPTKMDKSQEEEEEEDIIISKPHDIHCTVAYAF
jgi:hypothetical protein